ncbi:TetR family transcriptional regulator [Alteromonas ponticola]|uniref:TetR family transcriptional regulator n=1 Tax=Alteromonas aquimaris TaxID=2998417 RepID=A0ABT3PB05_9ALTE|nr:TetR family transcriptional regulator [Alteromonas aquimaris]MCW8109961.1 TetR family transcriptional regulator [Alteromonas aquimaris]
MPRTALYNVENILNQAIEIFLEHSFHGAIMDEIIARTEFNRRGFYLEFGSKQAFLYRVLEHYMETQLMPVVKELEGHHGLSAVHTFFALYISLIHKRGCLLVNCVCELGRQDPKIREMGRHYLDRLQFDFIGCLEKAQRLGELPAHVNVESAALQLTSCVQGFAANAVVAESEEEMRIATAALLAPLQGLQS